MICKCFAILNNFMFLCKSIRKRFKSYKCMKFTHILLACAGFLFVMFATASTASAQNSSFEILAQGAKKDKFVAIKGEEIKPNETYAYMFSNLSRYKVLVRAKDSDTQVHIKILDKDKKEIFSNHHKKKYLHDMTFKCGKTGMYYVVFQEIKS